MTREIIICTREIIIFVKGYNYAYKGDNYYCKGDGYFYMGDNYYCKGDNATKKFYCNLVKADNSWFSLLLSMFINAQCRIWQNWLDSYQVSVN